MGKQERELVSGRAAGQRLALVLGGGGSKGALQAGLYRAMSELGIRPDMIVGTSVGAFNAAFIAAGIDPDVLAEGWAGLSFRRLFGFNWKVLTRGTAASSLFSPARLRRLLADRLPAGRLEDLPMQLSLVSTHMVNGDACVWERGDLVDAVLASISIPGILPPVLTPDGTPHVDGSLAADLPIDLACERGATEVIAMNCRTCATCVPNPTRLPEIIGAAFGLAADRNRRAVAERYAETPNVLLLQPELGEEIPTLDFSRGERLVREGYEYSLPHLREWLQRRAGEAA